MSGLRRHIPELAIEWQLDSPQRLWQAVDGTLCFADISGFTALAERLALQGRIGGEELVETLSRVFGGMLERARERDGMLLKFGGDALLFFFTGEGHAVRAASAAVEMRTALHQARKTPTSVGRLTLAMSVGIHSGPIQFFLVGSTHRELVLAGPDATMAASTEAAAAPGEIAVSPATAALLPAAAVRSRPDGTLLLRWRKPPQAAGAVAATRAVSPEILRGLFPQALGQVLEPGAPEPEHRVACIAFIRFSGTDALLREAGPAAVAEALNSTVATAQDIFEAEGITLLAIDLDSDGGKFFIAAGVPAASEDDEGRMLRALRQIATRGTPLPLQFGVNRGHVFAAEVGVPWRAAYSAMGDTTNTAARICAKAPVGAIYAHPSVLDNSRTLFATEPAGPFLFKGKKVPQIVYRVGEETGTRGREVRERLPLTGRDDELALLQQTIVELVAGSGGVLVVESAMGMGKTRLLDEALGNLEQANVIRLRAEPFGASSPYRVFRDLVRTLLNVGPQADRQPGAALTAGIGRADPALLPWAALLGDVAHVQVDPSPEVAALEPQYRPERTADALVQLLAGAHATPLVLVIDDAQWADDASSHLLKRLARECASRPWLLLVARRPDETGFAPQGAERIALEPLSATASAALVAAATQAAPLRPHASEMVVARGGGNPLFIEEIIGSSRNAGSLESLPGSLEAVIAAQIDALDPVARRLLRYAAVLGNSFQRPVLEGVLAALDDGTDLGALARTWAFIETDGAQGLRFRRPLVRDTAYEGLTYRVRRRLHRLAAEEIERTGDDVLASAGSLARHYSLAGDAARTWHYACLSADHARRAYANSEAASLYRMALDAVRGLAEVTAPDQARVWTKLGNVCVLAGMFDDSLAAYRAGSRLVEGDAVASAELLRLRALARERAGAFGPALREITAGRRLLAGLDEPAARQTRASLGALAAMVRFAQQRYDEALRVAEEAIAEARSAEAPAALAEALVAADSARLSLGEGSTGRMLEALSIYQSLGDLSHEGMVRGNLGCDAYLAGRWDEALDWFAGDQDLCRRAGNLVGAAIAAANIGDIRVKRRQLAEAEPELRAAIRVLRASGFNDGAACSELQLARALIGRDAVDEANSMLERIRAEFTALGQAANALEAALVTAHAWIHQGKASEALQLVNRAAAAAGDSGALLLPQVAEARARALAAVGYQDAIAAEIDNGLAAARRLGLRYEEAMLLVARIEITRAAGSEANPADLTESARILAGLGVMQPRGLP